MSEPTAQDVENARIRQEIAERFQREYDQCAAWAEQLFGPRYEPNHRHFLLEKEDEDRCRRTGERPTPAATVFTVRHAETSERRHFIIREGQPVEVAGYEEGFGPMLLEPHPTQGFTDQTGRFHHYHKFSLCWGGYERYVPKSAEQLAAMRDRRQEKAVEKEAIANPLFAEQILAEGYQPPQRKCGKHAR